jgi:hypothetical protein
VRLLTSRLLRGDGVGPQHQEKPDRIFFGLYTMCLSGDDQACPTPSMDIFNNRNNKNTYLYVNYTIGRYVDPAKTMV